MMKLTRLALLCTLFTPAVFAAPLTIDTWNPQEKGIFAVSSTLVSGPKEAVLFDAQFSVKDGEALVEKIRRSGKTLNKIVITSGDPDFYFGLQPLVKAFPNAKVVATQQVVDHIKATKDAKLAFWGPQMKDGAPTTLIVPQVLTSTTFMVRKSILNSQTATRLMSGSRRRRRFLAARAFHGASICGRPIPRPGRVASSGRTRWKTWRRTNLSA